MALSEFLSRSNSWRPLCHHVLLFASMEGRRRPGPLRYEHKMILATSGSSGPLYGMSKERTRRVTKWLGDLAPFRLSRTDDGPSGALW